MKYRELGKARRRARFRLKDGMSRQRVDELFRSEVSAGHYIPILPVTI